MTTAATTEWLGYQPFKGMTLRRVVEWSDHGVWVWVEHESGHNSRRIKVTNRTDSNRMEVEIGQAYLHLMRELRDEMRVYKEMGV